MLASGERGVMVMRNGIVSSAKITFLISTLFQHENDDELPNLSRIRSNEWNFQSSYNAKRQLLTLNYKIKENQTCAHFPILEHSHLTTCKLCTFIRDVRTSSSDCGLCRVVRMSRNI